MQRMHLLRFLRQSVFRNVAAVFRNEVLDAHRLGVCFGSGNCPRALDQCRSLVLVMNRAVDSNAVRTGG